MNTVTEQNDYSASADWCKVHDDFEAKGLKVSAVYFLEDDCQQEKITRLISFLKQAGYHVTQHEFAVLVVHGKSINPRLIAKGMGIRLRATDYDEIEYTENDDDLDEAMFCCGCGSPLDHTVEELPTAKQK